MPEEIYHLNENGHLEPMTEEPFALEDKLQELVAQYPKLLSGEQMDPNNPRRWILIGREQGIADIVGGSDRWALDHLLIDQDARPTLVEAKRSENSEIRRSIVGQMMDYAAHATQTWNVAEIRQAFEERCRAEDKDPIEELTALLQPDDEPEIEKFWEDVETNLRAANLRLLFVADSIPSELARVVEFLNEQMPRTEVLAVEIKQFSGQTGRTLVPRVIGRTASAPDRSSKKRDYKTINQILDEMPNEPVRNATERLVKVATDKGAEARGGSVGFSIRYRPPAWSRTVSLAWINPLPDYSGWMGTKEFTFGMSNYVYDDEPPGLHEILKTWAAEFKDDTFATRYPHEGLDAWIIKHKDASDNIDVIAKRLERVLDNLRNLPMSVDPA